MRKIKQEGVRKTLECILFKWGPWLNAILALIWCIIHADEELPGRAIVLTVASAVICLVFALQTAHCFGLL